jgi:hypothetical protein
MAAGAAAARAFEGVTECAPHPAHAPSHACVRARDTGACNMPWVQLRGCLRRTLRESSSERPDGDGAGGGSSEAGRVLVAASRRRNLSAAGRRTGVNGRRWLGLTDDWRRSLRAGVELSGVRERVPISAPSQAAGRALSLASVISASVTRRRPASRSSVEAPTSPSFSPPIPLSLSILFDL